MSLLQSIEQTLDNQFCHITLIKARQEEQIEGSEEVLQQYVGPTYDDLGEHLDAAEFAINSACNKSSTFAWQLNSRGVSIMSLHFVCLSCTSRSGKANW